jgi:integrase
VGRALPRPRTPGFRENTRDEYRRDLNRYALAYFGERVRVAELSPRHIAKFIAWLCDDEAQTKRHETEAAARAASGLPALRAPALPLADASVRRIVCPLRACLGSAVHEGLIRSNPCGGAALPARSTDFDADDPDEVKSLTSDQLATFLAIVDTRHRLLFRLLASTGLRISEALALQWRHLQLDGARPHVKVRRAIVKGVMGPPKSKHGRREVPLSADLVTELRAHRSTSEWPGMGDLVFPALGGGATDQSNLRRRAMVPAAQEAGVPWIGFHTFRHTCASMLFDRGRNAKQVQRWLGHHSPAYTLATYVHLLEDELGDPLELPNESKHLLAGPTRTNERAAAVARRTTTPPRP